MRVSEIVGTWDGILETVKITVQEFDHGDIFTVLTKPTLDRREMDREEVEECVRDLINQGFEKL